MSTEVQANDDVIFGKQYMYIHTCSGLKDVAPSH